MADTTEPPKLRLRDRLESQSNLLLNLKGELDTLKVDKSSEVAELQKSIDAMADRLSHVCQTIEELKQFFLDTI